MSTVAPVRRFFAERLLRPSIAEAPYDLSIRLGVAALIAASLALVAGVYDVGPSEPQVWFYSRPIADAAVVLMLIALALGAWAVATAAAVATNARPLLAGIALLTCGAAFTVLDGATRLARSITLVSKNLPSFRVEWQPVPAWTLALMVATSVVPAVVLLLPGRLLRRTTTGFLISLPLWVATAVWALSSHRTNVIPFHLADGLPADVVATLAAPRSASTLKLFSGIAAVGLAGWLVILILLSGSEFARAQVTVAGQVSRLRPMRHRVTLIASAVLILVVLALGYLGVFGDSGIWRVGSLWQWLYAGFAAVVGAVAMRWEWRHPIQSGRLRTTVAIAITALGIPSVILLCGSLLQLILGPIVGGEWASTALDWARWFQRYDGLTAVVVVALATVSILRSDRRLTTGSMFGIAFVVWAFPSALQVAIRGDRFSGDQLLSSPQRLVVFVCLAVLVLAVRAPVDSLPLLLQTLVGATISGFGIGALLSGSPATAVAVLLVILPLLWRFLVDTREEREKPAWKSVVAMATWATLIGLAAFTVGAGSGVGLWDNDTRVEWNLVIVPLTFALLCQTERAPQPVGPGWKGSTAAGPVGAGGPFRYAAGVLAAVVIVASAVVSVAKVPHAVERPLGHQATITVPSGWVPGQCDLTEGEIATMFPTDQQNFVIFGNAPAQSLRTASTRADCPMATLLQQSLDNKLCTGKPSTPLADLAGLSWYACTSPIGPVEYAFTSTSSDVRAVLVITRPNATTYNTQLATTSLGTLSFS